MSKYRGEIRQIFHKGEVTLTELTRFLLDLQKNNAGVAV